MTNYPPRNNFLTQLFKKDSDRRRSASHKLVDHPNDNTLLNYYASLAVYHPDLIIVISTDGKVISQNRSSINELLGYSPDENINYEQLLSKEKYSSLHSAFYKTLKGKPRTQEVSILTKYGQRLFVTATFIPIKKADNTVVGIFLVVQNNTSHQELKHSLELKERHLTHAQQIAEIGSWEYIIGEDRFYASDNSYDIFGIEKTDSEPSMDIPLKYTHPDDSLKVRNTLEKAIKKGIDYTIDYRIFHGKTNQLRYLKVHAEVLWQDKKPYKLIGIVKDETTQKELEIQMDKTQKDLRHIFNNLHVGIWMKEYDTNKVTYVSKWIEEITQIPLDLLYNDDATWENMVHPAHIQEVFEHQKLLKDGETIFHQYRINCMDGTTKWVFDQTVPYFNDEGKLTHLFGLIADITPEVEMRQQLDYFATHDMLTALPNQRNIYDKLDSMCEANKHRFALLYLDLDRFKLINDSLGYQIGDEVLKRTSNRLLSALPTTGYIGRISSNDFIVIIDDYKTKDSIYELAGDMINRIEEQITIDGYELNITTSIGISFYPENGDNKLTLIESAHAALYQAKQHGKNNFQIFSYSKDITSYKKYVLEKDMRKAIDKQEFELYYQPQVETNTGVIRGAEALIRWHHAEWGLVSPGEFIPLAEENHLINHIGDWVIQKVCSQLREWKDNGYSLRPISINVSPIRFMKKGLVDLVKTELEKHNIPAKYLEIEITESSLLKNEKNVLAALEGLKSLGVKIAIDDFGTGYASLNYLREFDADTIKIDQIFIQNITADNKKDTAIISSVLHLAKGLEMKVIAEGVEEYEQLEFLKQNECDEIQGYLFSKPVPLDTYEQMLQTGYIKPTKPKVNAIPEDERRSFYRVEFPYHVLGEMSILEVNERKVELGSAPVIIEDIGLGGLKILSSLKLPVNSTIKFKFHIKLMGENFYLNGDLVWKNEGKGDTFYYGIKFDINEPDEDRLAAVINKMTVLINLNHDIPDTDLIKGNPYAYLQKNNL
ncbi:EAL domain-containing protein [Virgibacillus byunsanensis]|uniref:EAL domain-containing protein n=1 Tax=Virgibacillus byunsanensis TaxID=570945 RepID=A0ABW3LSU1_9BACI